MITVLFCLQQKKQYDEESYREKSYTQSAREVLQDLGLGAGDLTTAQAQECLAKYGPNKLEEAEKPMLIRRFLPQLKDPVLIIPIVETVKFVQRRLKK